MFYTGQCRTASVKQLEGGIKSIISNNAGKLVRRLVAAKVDENQFVLRFSAVATNLLAKKIMQCVSCPVDDDEPTEKEVSDDGDITPSSGLAAQWLKRDLTLTEKAYLDAQFFKSAKQLVESFLPSFMTDIIIGGKRRPSIGCSIFTWLRLFNYSNKQEFSQLIFPQPNAQCRYHGITSTVLSFVIIKYRETLSAEEIQQLPDYLKQSAKVMLKTPDALWNAVFPQLSKFSSERNRQYQFLHFINTDGYLINALMAKLNSETKTANGTANSMDWRSKLAGRKEIAVDELAGDRLNAKEGVESAGMSSINGHCGLVYLDRAVTKQSTGSVATGIIQAQNALQGGRVVIGVDMGNKTLASMVAVKAEINDHGVLSGWFKKSSISAAGMYMEAGYENFQERQQRDKSELRVLFEILAENHARTADLAEYDKFAKAAMTHLPALRDQNRGEEAIKIRIQAVRKRQAFFAGLLNRLLALVDSMAGQSDKSPILVIGNPTFKASRGYRSTCPKWLLKYLGRHFLVLVVSEYNTSQKCPRCLEPLEQHGKGIRLWHCTGKCRPNKHPNLPFVVNKDVSAAMNMVTVAIALIAYGRRPLAFVAGATCGSNKKRKRTKTN